MAQIDLVEDDVSLQRLVSAALEEAGHRVRVIGTLDRGLEWSLRVPPDLLITDLGLPDGSGLELVRRLHGRAPEVPILVISGADTPGEQERVLGLGASDFLSKPFTSQELLTRCGLLLRLARSCPLPRAM